MAKKERVQIETPLIPVQETVPEEELIFEAEAYGSPQPDEGSDVTVMKPVGIGGPVPIVAPKHNTIQLQPIVVPLAVVPYMTQDSSVLRTDGRTQAPSQSHDDIEATEFKAVDKEKAQKKRRPLVRLYAFISFLLSALVTLPFILSYFKVTIGSVDFNEFNTIWVIQSWIDKSLKFSFYPIARILDLVVMAMAMLTTLILLIGLIAGRYPRPISGILSFVALGCMIAQLVNDVVKHRFVIKDRIIFVVMLALLAILFVLSIVFSVLINRMEDRAEQEESEI